MQLEDLPPELMQIILEYKHEMELLEEWLHFWNTIFSNLLFLSWDGTFRVEIWMKHRKNTWENRRQGMVQSYEILSDKYFALQLQYTTLKTQIGDSAVVKQ